VPLLCNAFHGNTGRCPVLLAQVQASYLSIVAKALFQGIREMNANGEDPRSQAPGPRQEPVPVWIRVLTIVGIAAIPLGCVGVCGVAKAALTWCFSLFGPH
jgi:hypothetical protein